MKKLYLALAMALLLVIPLVSAADFDNVKVEEDGYIVIKNMFNLPIVGEDLAKLSTTTSLNNNMIFINDPDVCSSYSNGRGYDCLIAEYTIESYTSFDGALDDNLFYNINKDMEEINKGHTIRYKVLDGKKEVIDYTKVCEELGNKSTSCSNEEDGSHLEDNYIWSEKVDTNIKVETITLGIFTDIKDGEYTEWIPEIMGVKIDEWLSFFGATKLEFNTEADQNYDVVWANNIQFMPFNTSITGPAGNYSMGGVELMLKKTGTPSFMMEVSIWNSQDVNEHSPDTKTACTTLVNSSLIPGTTAYYNITLTGCTLYEGENYGIMLNDTNATGSALNSIEWHMVNSDTYATGLSYDWIRSTDGGGTWAVPANRDFNFIVWSEAITTPTVTLNSPGAFANFSVDTVTFNCSATDDGTVQNISLIVDDAIEATTVGGFLEEDVTSLAEGSHTWTCNATDNANTVGTLATRNFTIDTIDPILVINYPTGDIALGYSSNVNTTAYLNWSSTDTNLDTCWFLNQSSGVNKTMTCGSNATMNIAFGTYTHEVYANDTLGNTGTDTQITTYTYKVLENSLAHNVTSYETSPESFKINVTKGSTVTDVTANFWYNGTKYTPTEVDSTGSSVFSYSFANVPLLGTANKAENRSIVWEIFADTTSLNKTTSQDVNPINMTACTGGNSSFMNVTFKDEKTLARINATMAHDLDFYLGDGTIYRSNVYQNTSFNIEYNFCFGPADKNFTVTGTGEHYETNYPLREFDYGGGYTNASTSVMVYLLGSSDGIYTTFQVLSTAEQPISGVATTASTTISGSTLQIDAGTTGDDGGVTFWVNPDSSHTFTFSKTGYTDLSTSLTPTQSQYTVYLGGSSSNATSSSNYLRGITYTVRPKPGPIVPNTNYTFEFNLSSNYWDLDSWGYTLWGNDTLLASNSSAIGTGGSLSSYKNSINYTTIKMKYYWVINGTYINSTTFVWKPIEITNKGYGLKTFIDRWSDYMDGGMFGATPFTKYLLIFLLMFGLVGLMSYSFGITDPEYLLIVIGSIVVLFDGVLGLLPGNKSLSALSLFLIAIIIWRKTR